LFFENLGYWKAAAKCRNLSKALFEVIWGRTRIATQVVDFHDNSGQFRLFFEREGSAFIPARPPALKKREMLPNSRRCGVSVVDRHSWRIRARPIALNQT